MIIGIGIDVVDVHRVEQLFARHPERAADRLFTAGETAHCRRAGNAAQSFAARFAAKEALFKALGTGWTGGASWREVEVCVDRRGAPSLKLHGETAELAVGRGVGRVHVSLTHTATSAAAVVVLEGQG